MWLSLSSADEIGERGGYSRGAFELRPQFVEYVGMRPSNPPRNVASFKNAESVATAPQLRAAACDGALSASHGGSHSALFLTIFVLSRVALRTSWVLSPFSVQP